MKDQRPVVKLDSLLDWIRCPMRSFWKRKKGVPAFEYESLLRTMLLNTLKAGYRDSDPSGAPELEKHSADIWEYLLRAYRFPDPKSLVRSMNRFCAMRDRYLESVERKYRDSSELLNTSHWWDTGLVFDSSYYQLRNEISEFQSLLGLPDWQMVRSYYWESEYFPVSLADVFCDYMSGIRLFEFRKIPGNNIRFDVPAFLPLRDIKLAVRFDILWRRERVYRSVSKDLKPGLIAEQLVPLSVFSSADRIRRERMALRDIRLPLIGADYRGEDGKKIRIDSVSCCTFPLDISGTAWKESDTAYDSEALSAVLSRLNRYGLAYLKASEQNLHIPSGLVRNEICASCSYLKDCITGNLDNEDPAVSESEAEETGCFDEFLDAFTDKACLCDTRIRAMELLVETLSFLKAHDSRTALDAVANTAENLRRDFILGGKGENHAASKEEI